MGQIRIKLCCIFITQEMSSSASTSMHETTRLENTTFNLISQLHRDADFLYSTVDTYISDAKRDGRSDAVNVWNTIKQDKIKHMQMLREALAKEAAAGKIR
jgi:hypothetical protein